jgi:hypothetical protein
LVKKIAPTDSKRRKLLTKTISANDAKPAFIGRLEGVFRIVGDIESPVVPPEAWECLGGSDLERINRAAEEINAEASDVLDYQAIDHPSFPADAKRRGRGRPRHTSRSTSN